MPHEKKFARSMPEIFLMLAQSQKYFSCFGAEVREISDFFCDFVPSREKLYAYSAILSINTVSHFCVTFENFRELSASFHFFNRPIRNGEVCQKMGARSGPAIYYIFY